MRRLLPIAAATWTALLGASCAGDAQQTEWALVGAYDATATLAAGTLPRQLCLDPHPRHAGLLQAGQATWGWAPSRPRPSATAPPPWPWCSTTAGPASPSP